MRVLTVHMVCFIALVTAGCATTPLPSKAAFSEQVLDPLAASFADEVVSTTKANAVYIVAKWKKEHPPGADLSSLIGSLLGHVLPGLGGMISGSLGQSLSKAGQGDPDAALAESLAWIDTRRAPFKAQALAIWEDRIQEHGDVFSVCVRGKERRYQRAAGWPRLDDGPGLCPTTPINLKD